MLLRSSVFYTLRFISKYPEMIVLYYLQYTVHYLYDVPVLLKFGICLDCGLIGHVDIGIIFLCVGNSHYAYITQSKSDWLFNTQSSVLQADWWILHSKEKPTLNINIPYFMP